MFSDKRRAPRFAVEHRVEVSFSASDLAEARGLNLSEGGLLCQTSEPIGLYAEVDLHLHLSQNPPREFRCQGTVVRVERLDGGYLSGIAFTTNHPEFKNGLSQFLTQVPPHLKL